MDNEGVDASFDLVPRANHRGDAAGPARLKNLLVSSAWDVFCKYFTYSLQMGPS